ncbi:NAD(P)H-binding protein [Nocardia sp. NPDC004168]|uniref:NAD(P)-dependent oxidoreductase n=1 Tax=Nocardia TaxID=1817 RepID=UPI0033B743DB
MAAIAVLGATGRTGRMVVDRALARGHRVTAIVRPATTAASALGSTVVTADPCAAGSLTGLLGGYDAVISALGATGRGPATVYSAATAEIIAAMRPGGRLLVISSAALDVPADAGPGARVLAAVLRRVMRHTYSDMARMEHLLAQSDLRWTSVRPTGLTDAQADGSPRVSVGAKGKVGPRTSRADLADYLLDAIDDPHTYRSVVAVSS